MIGLHGRVIWHRGRWHTDRARALRSTVKDFAGEKRAAIVREAEHHEAQAAAGRNLYRCSVCDVWGTIDDTEAFICSDACKKRFEADHMKPKRRRRQ